MYWELEPRPSEVSVLALKIFHTLMRSIFECYVKVAEAENSYFRIIMYIFSSYSFEPDYSPLCNYREPAKSIRQTLTIVLMYLSDRHNLVKLILLMNHVELLL